MQEDASVVRSTYKPMSRVHTYYRTFYVMWNETKK